MLSNPRILHIPLLGRFAVVPDRAGAATRFPGGVQFHSKLQTQVIRCQCASEAVRDLHAGFVCPVGRHESIIDHGSGVVTDAGCTFGANDFANVTPGTNDISNFNYQDSGTGVVAAAVGDTGLGTPSGGARVAGTQTSPASKQARSVATISYTSTLAITEWGLFSATTAGTLWDRKVFSAINVVNGDSIQFTYTLTWTSGG